MPKNSQKEVRKDAMLKIGMVLLVVLIIANTIQLSRFGEIVERVDRYNRGVVDELGGFRQDIMTFGSDMNEMRSFLLLPAKDYSFADQEIVIEDDAQETSSTEKAIYQFMGMYTDGQRAEKNALAAQERMAALSSNQELKSSLEAKELTMSGVEQTDESSSFKILSSGEALYAVITDKKSNTIRIQSALGTKGFDQGLSEEAVVSELAAYVGSNKEKVAAAKEKIEGKKAGIVNLASNQELGSIINEKGIQFDTNPEENEDGFHYSFLNSEGTKLLTIDLLRDGHYQVNKEEYESEEQLAAMVIEELKNSNSSTALEQMVAERRTELETIFQDPAFQELLSSNNLSVSAEPREEYNKVLYDVTDANGNVQFSFVIELSSGLFKVLQDNEEIDLYSVLLGSKKKTLELPENIPDYGKEAKIVDGQLNILVAGKHGSLVDTMIIANINPAKGKITLVSVPRDLYYNNRKINSIYHFYGMEELKRTLSFITGYQIDQYILIDMYAFIEVVDIIGGVDVHLDQPVIDPTYKTFDGGKWGTLYYRAGDHHLSGKQALRLARSRHTSSDFARSERQHMILQAVKEKTKTLGLGDAGSLKALGENILAKTETDISIADAISYFFRYQNYEINGGHVMSSGNVLASKYTGEVDGKPAETCTTNEEGEETCKTKDKGAYILVPRNGSWNTTRWFFHQIIEEEA